jgi:GxxExxY protein
MANHDPFTDEANNSFDTPPAAPRDDDTPRHRGTEAYKHDPLTHRIIGCAIEVHRQLGPGLFEHTYEEALCLELTEARLSFVRQVGVPVYYKGHLIGEHRPDLVVQDNVVIEVKKCRASHCRASGAIACVHAVAQETRRLIAQLQ